jgi:hypothetical protein
VNNAKEYLDFFNQEYEDPSKHSNYSTNSNFRFDTRADALEIKNMLLEKSPSAKQYLLSVEYINPNRSMQVGWYITVRKLADQSNRSTEHPDKGTKPDNAQRPTDHHSDK